SAVDLAEDQGPRAIERTLESMHAGADVILQGALQYGRWFGRPDVLRRVERPSSLGAWSYEAADTKLAAETRGGTILQLVLYTELLSTAQGLLPEYFHVVTPNPEMPVQRFRVQDYAAYFRLVRSRLEATTSSDPQALADAIYPEPVS